MRALSIQQPWAWLIVNADSYPDPKRIENRTWSTRLRGQILIHAGLKFDRAGYDGIVASRPDLVDIMPAQADFARGGIVGEATIVDCVEQSDSAWFFGPKGFVLADAKPLPFQPCRGALSFFKVDVLLNRQLTTATFRGVTFQISGNESPSLAITAADMGVKP